LHLFVIILAQINLTTPLNTIQMVVSSSINLNSVVDCY